MAISEDPSTPATIHSTSSGPYTLAFSAPAGSLLVALIGGTSTTTSPTSYTLTNTGPPLTWSTNGIFDYEGFDFATVQAWTAHLTSAATMTVSVSQSGGGSTLCILFAVRVVVGAASSQSGAGYDTGGGIHFGGEVLEIDMTTTTTGSSVYIMGAMPSNTTLTALSNTTQIDLFNSNGTCALGMQASATGTPTTQNEGWSAADDTGVASCLGLEILPF